MNGVDPGATRPIYTPEQHDDADRRTVESGVGFEVLVNRAATAVAEVAVGLQRSRALVLCGPGNNGADALIAAGLLDSSGIAVDVRQWPNESSRIVSDLAALDTPHEVVIVDGMLGSGLSRPVEPSLADIFAAIDTARGAGAAVLAIDVPSGLDGKTGRPMPVCVSADVTVTFSFLKPGHVLLPGRQLCGETHVVSIGIGSYEFAKPTLWENTPALWNLPRRDVTDHKYTAGHCLVVSGDRWHTGASRLAALGALRIGAGAVTVAADANALAVHAHHLTEVMLHPIDTPADLGAFVERRTINTIALGPALGVDDAAERLLDVALASRATVVADADAITIMSRDQDSWLERTRRHGSTILTPHHAEFERLFGDGDGHQADGDKVAATRRAAAVSGAVVVHKGADTVVAAPDARAVINTNAPSSLATAGSGDVLTGMITGLVAQGMEPFGAACAGVWLHGDAASRAPTRLIASDLLSALAR